jgi:hypothetical protein
MSRILFKCRRENDASFPTFSGGFFFHDGDLFVREAVESADDLVDEAVGRLDARKERPERGGKDGKTFGYKAHVAVDKGSHLIREVKATDASGAIRMRKMDGFEDIPRVREAELKRAA